jgi:glycosyltransferase involved in cell wall biosynthesis
MTRDAVLVFEPEHGGHQPAYVRLLAEWVSVQRAPCRVVFAVSGRLLERLQREDAFDLRRQAGCDVIEIAPAAADSCFQGPLHRRSFARLRLMRELVPRASARHVISLFLDPLQLALALQRRLPRDATLSGILFRPSVHEIYAPTAGSSVGERLRDLRKRLLYRLMLRNPTLTDVLCLDPYFPSFAQAEFGVGKKVRALPDPVVTMPAATSRPDVGADLLDSVSGREVVFTLFGALAARKGVLQVLDALALLPGPSRAKVRVVLAGNVEPDIADEFAKRIRRLRGAHGADDCLRVVDRFLTTRELAWLVRNSTVILAPYQRFVGSSGVLGWAAEAHKPVIAQDYGLVGALVRNYRLGLTVDAADPARIAAAMSQLVQPGQLEVVAAAARWDDFLVDRRPEAFAAAVFAGLLAAEGGEA